MRKKDQCYTVIGVDPGSQKMGYGIITVEQNNVSYIASGTIISKGSLATLFKELTEVVKKYHPIEAVVEKVFFHMNVQSALVLGQARGVALAVLELEELKITHYDTRQVKKTIVGYGAASKSQIQKMVQRLLSLSSPPSQDAADALALALCHVQSYKIKIVNTLQ